VGVDAGRRVDRPSAARATTVAVAVTLTDGGAPVTMPRPAVVTPPGATASIEVPLTTGRRRPHGGVAYTRGRRR